MVGSRRREYATEPFSCRISGTAIPTSPVSSRWSRAPQPAESRMSGFRTSTASYGSAAATPALIPAAYPALYPVGTTRQSGTHRRATATVSSAESLSTTMTWYRSPANPSGSEVVAPDVGHLAQPGLALGGESDHTAREQTVLYHRQPLPELVVPAHGQWPAVQREVPVWRHGEDPGLRQRPRQRPRVLGTQLDVRVHVQPGKAGRPRVAQPQRGGLARNRGRHDSHPRAEGSRHLRGAVCTPVDPHDDI